MESQKTTQSKPIDKKTRIVFFPLFASIALILICFIVFHTMSEKMYYKTAKHYGEIGDAYEKIAELNCAVTSFSQMGGSVALAQVQEAEQEAYEAMLVANGNRFSYEDDIRVLVISDMNTFMTVRNDLEYLYVIETTEAQQAYAQSTLMPDLLVLMEGVSETFALNTDTYNAAAANMKIAVIVLSIIILISFLGFVSMGIYMLVFIRQKVSVPVTDILGWSRLFEENYAEMADLSIEGTQELEGLAEAFNHVKNRLIEANALKEENEKALRKLKEEEAYHKKYVQKFHEEKKEKDDISARAKRDGLTGLYNRRSFDDLVEEFLRTKPAKAEGALFLIDMDNFKNVNDTLGHMAGDEALKKLGGTMSVVFPGGYLGRYGGDEFVAFMTMGKEEIFRIKAKELCYKMDTDFTYGDGTVHLSVSVGVVSTNGVSDYSELYMKVDRALYYAKEHGRNQYKMASELED